MSKIKGVLNLTKNKEIIYKNFIIKGIKDDNKIIYKENDISVTIYIENNTIKMKRNNSEYIIEMIFENNKVTKGSYYLKEYKKNIIIDIKTFNLTYIKSKICLEYNLSMANEDIGHFIFSLELEVES